MLGKILNHQYLTKPIFFQQLLLKFSSTSKFYSKKDIAKHNLPNDCWIVIDNIVYNVSDYWKVHPGGGAWLLKYGGKDATIPFREYGHSTAAQAMLRGYGIEIGKLKENESFDEKFFAPSKIKFEKKVKSEDEKKLLYPEKMSCQQCQQTAKNLGCSTIGVCGKTPAITFLQDNIIHYSKGLAQYLAKPETQEFWDDDLYHSYLEAIFATLTNVNFDRNAHLKYLEKLSQLRDKYKQIYEEKAEKKDDNLTNPASPSSFQFKKDIGYLMLQGKSNGVEERKKKMDENLFALVELCVYGYKGLAAYLYHAEQLRQYNTEIYTDDQRKELFKKLFEIFAGLTNPNPTLESLLGLNMAAGAANVTAMEYLDRGHTTIFGKPTPGITPRTPVEGKCILVSGHDMLVLKKLLEQTEGTGINVYTHGEMLPAFSYPELRKHKHLVANFGQAWFAQNEDFAKFPGPILLNSNCLIQPMQSYKNRIFTTHAVGWEGIQHIEGLDFSKVIEVAKQTTGFKADTEVFKQYSLQSENNGYGHETMTELLVPAIQSGAIKKIYVVGGCDNIDPERDFYKQFVLSLPKNAIVLALGCGKYRILGIKDQMGSLEGKFSHIPRILDIGQCNDAYSAVKVALNLAELLKCSINDLPLRLVLSWVEQKAVIILLSLLSLGVQNIIIGPNLPGFLTPTLISYLVKNFNLSPTYANNMFSATQQLSIIKPKQETQKTKVIKEFEKVRPFSLYKLTSKQKVARDTFQYTFAFNNPGSVYSLDAAKHILIRGKANDGYYQSRAYTPITPKGFKGSFDVLIRTYKNGLISTYLDQTKVGEYVEIQGPCGSYTYAKGKFVTDDKTYHPTHINMIGGGVGNSVLFSLVQDIILHPKDRTQVAQIAAFSSLDLILLRKETESLVAKKKDQVKVVYNNTKQDGRISQDKFEKYLFPNTAGKVLNIISGPDSFRNQAITYLKKLNFTEDNMVFYY